MMLTSDAITCSLVTVHVGYREVPALLTRERIRDTIELTAEAMERLRGRKPRLLVCGLNPARRRARPVRRPARKRRIIVPAIADARARASTRRPAAARHRVPAEVPPTKPMPTSACTTTRD